MKPGGGLRGVFARERRLWLQQRRIQELERELDRLRTQNESMREGMRRCLTCDYRLEVLGRTGPEQNATKG